MQLALSLPGNGYFKANTLALGFTDTDAEKLCSNTANFLLTNEAFARLVKAAELLRDIEPAGVA
jgi:hypothetical protein